MTRVILTESIPMMQESMMQESCFDSGEEAMQAAELTDAGSVRTQKQVEAIRRDLAAQFERVTAEAENDEKMGVDVERWRQMVVELRTVGLISVSSRGNERDNNGAAPEFPAKQEFQPDSMCAKEELREMLMVAMKTLPERYKKVVVLYYTNDMTMKEIGGLLGINESRVSQIHKTALEKMAIALQSAGIHSSGAV